jgi:hypothetical protein
MSATAGADLTVEMQIAQIQRNQEETRKFAAEMHKLTAETLKLAAEARKFDRERWLIVVGAIGGVAGMIAAIVTAAKSMGWIG